MSADRDESSPQKPSSGERLKQKAKESGAAAKEKLDALRDDAEERVRDVGERAAEVAEERRAATGDRIAQVARALNKAAEELDEGSTQRQIFEKAAEGVDDLAGEIQDKSIGQLVGEVADFGRRNPVTFVGGAALLGFALARFTSASPVEEREEIGEDPRAQAGERE